MIRFIFFRLHCNLTLIEIPISQIFTRDVLVTNSKDQIQSSKARISAYDVSDYFPNCFLNYLSVYFPPADAVLHEDVEDVHLKTAAASSPRDESFVAFPPYSFFIDKSGSIVRHSIYLTSSRSRT